MRRRQLRLRQILIAASGLAVVAVAARWIAWTRLPQLGDVAWSVSRPSEGMPRISLGPGIMAAVWESGRAEALHPGTGQLLWREPFARARGAAGPPVAGLGCVVFGSTDCAVWCLDAKTGAERWHYAARAIFRSMPIIAGDRTVIGGDDGRLYALRLADGRCAWTYPGLGEADRAPILGGPVAVGSAIVCGSADRTAFGLDAATGRLLWRRRVYAPVIARATADGDRAYVAAEDGVAWCFEAATGRVIWTFRVAALLRFPIVARGDGRAFVLGSNRTVWCVNALTGAPLWRRYLPARPAASAIAQGGRLYLGLSNGWVIALRRESGRPVWHWQSGAKPLGDVLVDTGHLYCTTNTDRIFAVRLPTR
jgi:outer membrane protein assembly factor BamB